MTDRIPFRSVVACRFVKISIVVNFTCCSRVTRQVFFGKHDVCCDVQIYFLTQDIMWYCNVV